MFPSVLFSFTNISRIVTGASFIIFNGALKPNKDGVLRAARLTIVEDGLMVLMSEELVVALKQSLRNMDDFIINCGSSSADGSVDEDQALEELVSLHWITDQPTVNSGSVRR